MQLEVFLDLDLFLKEKCCFYKNRAILLCVISSLPPSSHIIIFHAYELVLDMIFEQEFFFYIPGIFILNIWRNKDAMRVQEFVIYLQYFHRHFSIWFYVQS